MRKLLSLAILGVIWALFATIIPAQAQDITTLENSYRTLLDDYRREYDQFLISRQQYYTLKTLASQEETVQNMRTLLRTRADVLITYLSILDTHLQTDPGIDQTRSLPVKAQVETSINDLKAHRARVEIAVDRIAIDAEASFFESQEQPITVIADRAQVILAIARTQSAIDSMSTTRQLIDGYIQTASFDETTRTQKQRGSDELQRTIDTARSQVTEAWHPFDQAQLGNTSKIFNSIQSALSPSFANLTQAVAFSKELIK